MYQAETQDAPCARGGRLVKDKDSAKVAETVSSLCRPQPEIMPLTKQPIPRGTAHKPVGLLLRHGASLILRVDDGGEWRLDAPARAGKSVGRRVRVTGVREGFDLLAISRTAGRSRVSGRGRRSGYRRFTRHFRDDPPLHDALVLLSFTIEVASMMTKTATIGATG